MHNRTRQKWGIVGCYTKICKMLFTQDQDNFLTVAHVIMALELILSYLIVMYVPYTEIDWSTYMQQVECYVKKGIRNYSEITGDTGPVVYPGGHLAVYSELYNLTSSGTNIKRAQFIFCFLYLLTFNETARMMMKMKKFPPFVMILFSITGYRIHSIYMLRLFNDPVAMLCFYVAVNLFIEKYYMLGSVFFSAAVSIKMNILLFAPAMFFTLLMNTGIWKTAQYIGICAVVQILAGFPFLIHDWKSYLMRSFDLGRVFMYKWTVNWRFLPEEVFLDKRLHFALLIGHLTFLAFFASFMWFRKQGGISVIVRRAMKNLKTESGAIDTYFAFCTSNLIGIAFSRSLHYQFYSWYFHQLPFLLFLDYPDVTIVKEIPWRSIVWKVAVLLGVELCWNVYPSTWWSSALLHILHIVIISYLVITRVKRPLPKTPKNRAKPKTKSWTR